jgi:hypothetical protein
LVSLLLLLLFILLLLDIQMELLLLLLKIHMVLLLLHIRPKLCHKPIIFTMLRAVTPRCPRTPFCPSHKLTHCH